MTKTNSTYSLKREVVDISSIEVLNTGEIRTFDSIDSFENFVRKCFLEPGKYGFDSNIRLLNASGKKYLDLGYYCEHVVGSKEYIDFWDREKNRIKNGCIVQMQDGREFYFPGEYYFWLNFLPIYRKDKLSYMFPDIWDVQYHMSLYELLASINRKHCIIVKKRQIASSYFHAAKFIRELWFFEKRYLKLATQKEHYMRSLWDYLVGYRNFLNSNTAWYRQFKPDKYRLWTQNVEVYIDGRKRTKGNDSTLIGLVLQEGTGSVSGPTHLFFYDEAGITNNLKDTFMYIEPSMKAGALVTGQFIAAGSVGELDQCQDLKEMMYHPHNYNVYPVSNNLISDNGEILETGLFIPEHWGMLPYIDEYGNSLTDLALEHINSEREKKIKILSPSEYRTYISQSPLTLKDAFDYAETSVFPANLINRQLKKIEVDNVYPCEYVELFRNENGEIEQRPSSKLPISIFPLPKNYKEKEGVIQIWERPIKNLPFKTYYASVDPVDVGKSTTSESLAAVYIYRRPVHRIYYEGDESMSELKMDKIVACWVGRYDDIDATNTQIEMLVEYYNAWTLCENNVSSFIRHMISKKKTKYLMTKDEMLFLKNFGYNINSYQEYGWRNAGSIFRDHLLPYAIKFCTEVLYEEDNRIMYGIERIPDRMLLTEMMNFKLGSGNYDRIVAFSALAAMVAIHNPELGVINKVEEKENSVKIKDSDIISLYKRFNSFNNVGKSIKSKKSFFRHLK